MTSSVLRTCVLSSYSGCDLISLSAVTPAPHSTTHFNLRRQTFDGKRKEGFFHISYNHCCCLAQGLHYTTSIVALLYYCWIAT